MADAQYDSQQEPKRDNRSAAAWLDMLDEAKRCYQAYQDKCDSIDKLYADLKSMAGEGTEREFKIFWANLEVLKPSIYSRPPVPVVTPRFKDRKELPRKASEILERSLISSFEADDIDATMRLVRDDLATNSRGVIWCRYETRQGADGKLVQKVHKEHVDRKDFLHDPARKWKEVEWVARRVFLNRKQGLKRFGDIWLKAEFKENKADLDGNYKGQKKAEAWELWHKGEGVVVWVSPGMEEVLDIQEPFLTLEGFFPCPRPAYGTLQRSSMTPVPDFLYYKDQVEEINELTARISSLSESLRLKGFYPAGASDVGDAIETVLKDMSNTATLVPVNNFAAMGNQSLKDSIVWLPVREVAEVIQQLVELRRQLIDDVYQITGLSDIMRGQTDPNETKGAQVLKSQYGSTRIRDRQNELIRLARDVTRIEAEIMAENFEPQTLLEMSQIDDLPTDAAIAQQVQQITMQVQQAAADPRMQQMAQQQPDQAQQMLEQANAQVEQLQATVTLERVVALLREQRTRPFILEIETDSTIQPDEDAAKQRASEFITAVGGYMTQAVTAVTTVPQMAPLAAELLKFVASQFRVGRSVDGAIDEFADQMKELAAKPQGPNPEQVKAEGEKAKAEADAIARKAESDARMAELAAEAPVKQAEAKARLAEIERKAAADRQKANDDYVLGTQKIKLGELAIELAEVQLQDAKMASTDATTDLADAIAMHEKHMNGTLPTSDASQQEMMNLMKSAYSDLTAGRSKPAAMKHKQEAA